jgi:hypothetical protein
MTGRDRFSASRGVFGTMAGRHSRLAAMNSSLSNDARASVGATQKWDGDGQKKATQLPGNGGLVSLCGRKGVALINGSVNLGKA